MIRSVNCVELYIMFQFHLGLLDTGGVDRGGSNSLITRMLPFFSDIWVSLVARSKLMVKLIAKCAFRGQFPSWYLR